MIFSCFYFIIFFYPWVANSWLASLRSNFRKPMKESGESKVATIVARQINAKLRFLKLPFLFLGGVGVVGFLWEFFFFFAPECLD